MSTSSHKPAVTFEIETTSVEILPANLKRKYLLIQNRGTTSIFYTSERESTINDHEIVAGGNYEPSNVPVNSINLISASGSNNVVVTEGEN